VAALERVGAAPQAGADLRIRAGFALGKAREQRADHARAFAAYAQANQAVRTLQPWDAAGFSREIEATLAALPRAIAGEAARGRGLGFIVSPPRAGSTVAEQILAAHPAVAAGGERTELRDLIAQENARRGATTLAAWAGAAAAEDWRRLGDAYQAQ